MCIVRVDVCDVCMLTVARKEILISQLKFAYE